MTDNDDFIGTATYSPEDNKLRIARHRFPKSGGRLVALCANGRRQREQLTPLGGLLRRPAIWLIQ
jgi:hypothetical protein